MKEIFQIGISEIMTSNTAYPQPQYHLPDIKYYNIEMTNEYEEDEQIKYQDYLYGHCLDEGLTGAITQAEIKGTDEKAKDNFLKNIIEAIQLMEECRQEDKKVNKVN